MVHCCGRFADGAAADWARSDLVRKSVVAVGKMLTEAAVELHRVVRERRTAILMRGAAQPSKAAHTATAM